MSTIGVENVCYLKTGFDKNDIRSKSKIAIDHDTFTGFTKEMEKFGYHQDGITEMNANQTSMYLQGLNLIMPHGVRLNPELKNHKYTLCSKYDMVQITDNKEKTPILSIKPHTLVERKIISRPIDEDDKEKIVKNLYLYV